MIVPPLAREQKGAARDAVPPLTDPPAGSASCWLVTRTLVRGTVLPFPILLVAPNHIIPTIILIICMEESGGFSNICVYFSVIT